MRPSKCNKITLVFTALILFFGGKPAIHAATPSVHPSVLVLSLEDVLDISLNRNRSIIRSMTDRESAKLNLDSSLSEFDLKLRPSTGAGVTNETSDIYTGITISKEFMTGVNVSGTPYIGKTDDGFNSRMIVALDIPLFKYYGKMVNTEPIRVSEFSVRNAERSLLQTKENIFINTVTTFYNILEYKKNVELNRFLVKKFSSYSAIAKTKTDIGLADPLDVYRSEIQARNAQVSLSNSIERLQNAQYELKTLLAIPQDQEVRIKDTTLEIRELDLTLENAERIAFKNSLDIIQTTDNLNEKKRAEKIAKNLIKPDLKLSFQYSLEGESENFNDGLMDFNENAWGIFLVSSTDFSRKIEKNNYLKSRLNVRSAKMEMEEAKDRLSKQIRGQLDALSESMDRVQIIESKILDATGKLKLATVKFNNGVSGNFDMIEAETQLNQARLDLIRAKISYITETYRLRKTMGTLIQYNK